MFLDGGEQANDYQNTLYMHYNASLIVPVNKMRSHIDMSLTPEEVRKIAHLARLNLSNEDIARFTPQLSRILDFIEQMNKTDTSQVEPLAHPLDISQRLRTDVVTEPNLRDKYQQIAPQVEAGLYLVPKVIEEA
jgi:aspartyl-tRNA(Asn)/glutamyl-tRNA(Gln) amidotransferase subunit C